MFANQNQFKDSEDERNVTYFLSFITSKTIFFFLNNFTTIFYKHFFLKLNNISVLERQPRSIKFIRFG